MCIEYQIRLKAFVDYVNNALKKLKQLLNNPFSKIGLTATSL